MDTIEIGTTTVTETEIEGVKEYAWNDTHVYQIGIESFPGHITNTYLIMDGTVSLFDTGLGGKKALKELERGLEIISTHFRQKVKLEDISGIIISHGHADHWGLLSHPELKGKKVYIHELDSETLVDFQKRLIGAKERIKNFVNQAGWDMEMDNIFSLDKLQVRIADYELVQLSDKQKIINDYEVYHVPGHSPGSILLKIGPVLFLGDLILSETTPHQIPGSLIEGCGLRLYLDSLKKAASFGNLIGLPAHEEIIYSIKDRADEITVFHYQRLRDISELCTTEKNLFQITDEYYQLRSDYINGKTIAELTRDDQILALEEIGTHLEYLIENGRIILTDTNNGVLKYHAQ
jgi:glyoxylase-like metal-dependent hydrolase (beta-lactamase superfamily II)